MRTTSLLALALATLGLGCVTESDADSPDGIDDDGLAGGKADGTELSACEAEQILAWLNEGGDAASLRGAGVHARAANALVAHRDGPDGVFGTEDDDLFDSLEEVDAVPYVGRTAFAQLTAAVAPRCAVPADPYAEARDVTRHHVTFPEDAAAPAFYDRPNGGQFYLSGTEFWQKWSGGHNPTYSFSDGTDAGRRCMQASAIRFGEIMKDPPAELVQLRAESSWGGSFFNWNDDYSDPNAYGNGSSARLWAWRTHLIKWISQTRRDGTCYLPTLDQVTRAARACLTTAARNGDGEIQGCSAQ